MRDGVKLMEHGQVVPDHPVLGQPAVGDAVDVDVLNGEGRRLRDGTPRETAGRGMSPTT